MDASVLETMGQIAGIGGLVLAVVFYLLRDILRKTIFPRLTRDHAFRVLRQIITSLTIIGVLGIGAWVLADSGPKTSSGAPINANCSAVNTGSVSGATITVTCGERSDAH